MALIFKIDSRGFTIIELIVVIALLGILSAVALPRFIDVNRTAWVESTRSTMASFRTATTLANGQWRVKGEPSSIEFDGNTVLMNTDGWPDLPTNDSAGCIEIWNGLLQTTSKIEVFTGNPVDEWSALRFFTACVYINQNGADWDNTVVPFFSYFPTTGTGAEFNLD
ncbi:MAG: type II secretion system GspH family protein [Motiliproteus sp.]|nr:type II secretion system GspH family protein [Motiliproteus sp.]MCW9051489.1 type II secretion system GspH family protein [Motiliproteus sp.]